MKPLARAVLGWLAVIALIVWHGVPAESEAIVIATQSPLSGEQSGLGQGIRMGAALAVRDYAGLLEREGFRLELRALDDRATPQLGVQNAKSIVQDGNVLAVVGHLNSGVALSAGEVYERAGLAVVSPANTHPRLTQRGFKTFSRVVGRDDVQGPVGARYLVRQVGARTFVVVDDGTPYGLNLADAFQNEVKALGARVLERTSQKPEADTRHLVSSVKSIAPDAVFFAGLYAQGGRLLRALRLAGVRSLFSGGDGLNAAGFSVAALEENISGVTFVTTAPPITQFPSGRRFAQSYRAAFGANPEPYAIYAYDAAHVAIAAIQSAIRAGGGRRPSRAQVAAAVRAVSLNGLTGPIRFDANGDLREARYYVLRIDSSLESARVVQVLTVRSPGTPRP